MPRRAARRGLALAVVVAAGYLGVTAIQVWWTSRRNDAQSAQAIVVMGAAQYDGRPSPVLRARLAHVLALWRDHRASSIVVTGGKEEGDSHTEAQASAAWLEGQGVPASAIAAEVGGRDSWQSLDLAAAYLLPRHLSDVLLVSDPYHEERIMAMASSLGLDPHPSPTRLSPIRGWAAVPYYARETVAVAVGTIVGYGRLSRWMHGRLRPPAR